MRTKNKGIGKTGLLIIKFSRHVLTSSYIFFPMQYDDLQGEKFVLIFFIKFKGNTNYFTGAWDMDLVH